MDIERAAEVLRKARLASKDPEMSEVLKVLTQMLHEISIARSETALLSIRVEDLESHI